MRAKDFIPANKPRNFVAKNAMKTTSGAGAHRDKKKEQKQGYEKHKGKDVTEDSIRPNLVAALKELGFKGPFKLGQLPEWMKELEDARFDKDTSIMIGGDDPAYDAWVAKGYDYGYAYGMESGYQTGLSAQQVVKQAKADMQGMTEGSEFGAYYSEQVAQEIFDKRQDITSEDEVLNQAYHIVSNDKGQKSARYMFNYDEDFPSDVVSAYFWLKKHQGVAEAMSPQQQHDFDRMRAGAMSRQEYDAKWRKKRKSDDEVIYGKRKGVAEYGDTAKGQKMLTKVQKRAVDRMIKADDKRDAKSAKKNQDTANRAWDRMADVAEGDVMEYETHRYKDDQGNEWEVNDEGERTLLRAAPGGGYGGGSRYGSRYPRRPAYNKPKGYYFYNVPAGKENDAKAAGLMQSKSGKWYSTMANSWAEKAFGKGRYWEPKN